MKRYESETEYMYQRRKRFEENKLDEAIQARLRYMKKFWEVFKPDEGKEERG